MRSRYAVPAVLILLAACSTNPGTTSPPSVMPSPTPRDPATLDYVVLGDSLATGRGSGVSFADLYAHVISERLGVPVEVDNLASDGMTSDRLLGTLQSGASLRDAIATEDIVTISVGFDDIFDGFGSYADGTCGGKDGESCLRARVAEMRSSYTQILDEVLSLLGGHPAIVRVTDDYDNYVGNPPLDHEVGAATVSVIDRYVRLINEVRCRIAADRDIPCTDTYRAFNGDGTISPWDDGLLASDGQHLSEAGQQLVADTLSRLGLAPLG